MLEPDIEEAVAEARRTGSHLAFVEDHVTHFLYTDRETVPGQVVHAGSGIVHFYNLRITEADGSQRAPHRYDYRATVEFDREAGRHLLTELTAMRRPDGPDITARGLQGDRVGEVERIAISYVLGGVTEKAAGRFLDHEEDRSVRLVGRPKKLTDARLLEVADVCVQARAKGLTEGKVVEAWFGDCGSYSTARSWIAEAKRRFPKMWS